MSKSVVNLYCLLAIIVAILFIIQAPIVSARDKGKHTHYKYTVYILNGCESGIELPIHGQCHHAGNFSFIRLWCDISRGYTRTHQRASIVAFQLSRDSDEHRCGGTGDCYWKITEVGIYFGNNNSTWTRAYNWSSIAGSDDSNFIPPQQLPKSPSP